MNPSVLCSRQRHEVFDSVVHRVAVDVMNDVATKTRAVRGFPHNHRTLAPHIRLGHLHPHPSVAVPLVTHSRRHTARRKGVVRLGSWLKLSTRCAPSTTVDTLQAVVRFRRAWHRAVVDLAEFGPLAVEAGPANWANQRASKASIQAFCHPDSLPHSGTGTTFDLFGGAA